MSSKVKNDLMKEIMASVARKKEVSKQVSQQKTIARWVTDFFIELEKIKKIDPQSYLIYLNRVRLQQQIQGIDKRSTVDLQFDDVSKQDIIVIHWSDTFVQINKCEEASVFDASSAFFQNAMENI